MEIRVNGELKTLAGAGTVSEVLDALGYGGKQVAVAVDGTFLPRHRHGEHLLSGGEALEVLAPMQGG